MAWIERHRPLKQVPRIRRAPGRPLDERQIDERFNAAWIDGKGHPELRPGLLETPCRSHATPRLLCTFAYRGSSTIAR